MFKQIRTLMSEDVKLEGSSVEMDETYMGGKRKNGTSRPMAGDNVKTPVVGMVERKGRVVVLVAPDVTNDTLLGMVHERILPASTIYTDELHVKRGIGGVQPRGQQEVSSGLPGRVQLSLQ